MVRAYKRKLGARCYADYSPEQLEEYLQTIRDGLYTHRRAAEHFNIPRRRILNKLTKVGKPTIFSRDEEESFLSYIETLSDFGFPITTEDLRPTKVAWRKILSNWKDTPDGMKAGVLPKHVFPSLLKKLLEDLEPNMKKKT
ncbi:hypothetical protein J6590_089128 [Homalodisca vitripennis]|nr:hypothetical protein J6590_089128 [Homalodisca vitripennis]